MLWSHNLTVAMSVQTEMALEPKWLRRWWWWCGVVWGWGWWWWWWSRQLQVAPCIQGLAPMMYLIRVAGHLRVRLLASLPPPDVSAQAGRQKKKKKHHMSKILCLPPIEGNTTRIASPPAKPSFIRATADVDDERGPYPMSTFTLKECEIRQRLCRLTLAHVSTVEPT